jgi:hypothetical protein
MDNKKHIIDVILSVFEHLDDNIKIDNDTWYNIRKELLAHVSVSSSQISDYKESRKTKYFNFIYDKFLHTITNMEVVNDNKNIIYLNKVYENRIVNSNKMDIDLLYPNILNSFWLNDKIIFDNECFGIIIHNIIEHIDYLHKSENFKLIKDFVNYMFILYYNKKINIYQCDLEGLNMLNLYNQYIYRALIEYFGDFLVFYKTDRLIFANVKKREFEPISIEKYFETNIGSFFKFNIDMNLDVLFVDEKRYMVIDNGSVSYEGFRRINISDEKSIKNLSRMAKIKNIL